MYMLRTRDGSEIRKLEDFDSTADVLIPKDPLDRVIGQEEAVEISRIAASQRRHMLIVGPPGTGKSMIARAISIHIPRVGEEIHIVHNPENPERPFTEVKHREEAIADRDSFLGAEGVVMNPKDVPHNAAEHLGFRCSSCGVNSLPSEPLCPGCNSPKRSGQSKGGDPFNVMGILQVTFDQMGGGGKKRFETTELVNGKEVVVVYERAGEMIRRLDQKALEKRRKLAQRRPNKILVPVERDPFVLATGASETELLGDVRHDPYGGHPQLGSLPYERVVAGAIHEAHEGVLFIDELPHLGHIQRFILTAMQEKVFPISGRNPQSAGASVKVENVPCDFVFVGACNIQDLGTIISPLRSRIIGSGYEILVETTMPDTPENRLKLIQFVAQEVTIDTRIPHFKREAVEEIIREAKRRARDIDGKERHLTLRLRELAGLIRTAGDIAALTGAEFTEAKHIKYAIKRSRTIEEQIRDRYGSFSQGISSDISESQREQHGYNYWNVHLDDTKGYQ
jgi:ATP-dependent Lon protease